MNAMRVVLYADNTNMLIPCGRNIYQLRLLLQYAMEEI